MTDRPTPRAPRIQWTWWAITALLAISVAVDLVHGSPLKLATSALLFVACLLSAVARQPRTPLVAGVISACFGAAILLLIYRAVGPGL